MAEKKQYYYLYRLLYEGLSGRALHIGRQRDFHCRIDELEGIVVSDIELPDDVLSKTISSKSQELADWKKKYGMKFLHLE